MDFEIKLPPRADQRGEEKSGKESVEANGTTGDEREGEGGKSKTGEGTKPTLLISKVYRGRRKSARARRACSCALSTEAR